MSWFCARVVTNRLFDPFICLCIMAVGVASAVSLSYDDPEASPMAQEHSKMGNPLPPGAARYLCVSRRVSRPARGMCHAAEVSVERLRPNKSDLPLFACLYSGDLVW